LITIAGPVAQKKKIKSEVELEKLGAGQEEYGNEDRGETSGTKGNKMVLNWGNRAQNAGAGGVERLREKKRRCRGLRWGGGNPQYC